MLIIILLILVQLLANSAPAMASSYDDLDQSDSGLVTFQYDDNDFEQVYLTGSFTEWVRIPLNLENNSWTISYRAPEGRQF